MEVGDVFYAAFKREEELVLHMGIVCQVAGPCINEWDLRSGGRDPKHVHSYHKSIVFDNKADAEDRIMDMLLKLTGLEVTEELIEKPLWLEEAKQRLLESCTKSETDLDEVYSMIPDRFEPYG